MIFISLKFFFSCADDDDQENDVTNYAKNHCNTGVII